MSIEDDAKALLDQSDRTILRCAERGIMVPREWVDFRAELRAIASGESSDAIPAMPAYPVGS
ncbi:hypothetical protein ACYOEI_37060 [Singulisphaera rosea]